MTTLCLAEEQTFQAEHWYKSVYQHCSKTMIQKGMSTLFMAGHVLASQATLGYQVSKLLLLNVTWLQFFFCVEMLEVGTQRHPMFSEWCKMQDSHIYRNKRVTLNGYYNLTMLKPPLEFEKLTHLKIILGAAKGEKRKRTKKNLEPI